jgi:hypothetical protein
MRGLFGLGKIPTIAGFGLTAGTRVLSLIIIKGVIAGRYKDVQKSYYEIDRSIAKTS